MAQARISTWRSAALHGNSPDVTSRPWPPRTAGTTPMPAVGIEQLQPGSGGGYKPVRGQVRAQDGIGTVTDSVAVRGVTVRVPPRTQDHPRVPAGQGLGDSSFPAPNGPLDTS